MVVTTHTCKTCHSANSVLSGKNQRGSQTYKCKEGGACRVLFSVKKTENIDLAALEKTDEERNSLRSTARLFGVSHVTVLNKLKKSKVAGRV